jgi:hypothetical protein
MSRRVCHILLLVFLNVFAEHMAAASLYDAPVFETPKDYLEIETGPCIFKLPEGNVNIVDELDSVCKESLPRIFGQLGLTRDGGLKTVLVGVVGMPNEMKKVAPKDANPPSWSVAVAYPEHSLVILSLKDNIGRPVEELSLVFEHELSHLALRQALAGAHVPRWFSEGIAIHQSEESSFRRYWLVWLAARGNSLIPLDEIERYPDHMGKINLAYAQSADFLGTLLRKGGWLGIRVVLRRMAEGATFEDAIEFSYGRSLESLEKEWRSLLMSRWQWIPLLTGTGAIWGLIVILFFVAYVVVRIKRKKRLKEMAEEEAVLERTIVAMEKAKDAANPGYPKSSSSAKIPTKIRIDDEIHTLH